MNELLRQWAGGICAGCMLAGAVQVLMPSSRHTAVIKNIAVLYIVLAILSPAEFSVKLFDITERTGIEPKVLYDTEALENDATEGVLAKTFTDQLAAFGVQAEVAVSLDVSRGEQAVTVQAFVPTDAQSRTAELLLQEWVGERGTVVCRTQMAE